MSARAPSQRPGRWCSIITIAHRVNSDGLTSAITGRNYMKLWKLWAEQGAPRHTAPPVPPFWFAFSFERFTDSPGWASFGRGCRTCVPQLSCGGETCQRKISEALHPDRPKQTARLTVTVESTWPCRIWLDFLYNFFFPFFCIVFWLLLWNLFPSLSFWKQWPEPLAPGRVIALWWRSKVGYGIAMEAVIGLPYLLICSWSRLTEKNLTR